MKIFNRIVETVGQAVFTVIIVVTFSQVIARYVFNSPFTWSDEFARYCFVWVILLGSALAIRDNAHIGVDYFISFIPAKLQKLIDIVNKILIAAFLLFIIIQGYKMIGIISVGQISAAMGVPMSYIYFAIPIGALVCFIFLIRNIFTNLN